MQIVNAKGFEAHVQFKACNFLKNSVNGYGGAIYLVDSGNFTFEDCNFENNKAAYGGAIYFNVELESIENK